MNTTLPAATHETLDVPAARAVFARGVTVGFALGVVLGAALALALTHPVEDIVRVVRGHLTGEGREPRFELLN